MKTADKRLLVGRKIVGFDLHPFDDGKGGKAYAPVITLDNGAAIAFDVDETEVGAYGVRPLYFSRGLKGQQ